MIAKLSKNCKICNKINFNEINLNYDSKVTMLETQTFY